MDVENITEYDDNNDIIIQALKLSMPSGILFICLIGFIVFTLISPLINKK